MLSQLIEAAPAPAVALVSLFREALDSRGIPVEERLRALLVSLCTFFVTFVTFCYLLKFVRAAAYIGLVGWVGG